MPVNLSGSVGVNLITRSRLARMAGVSRAAITKACRGPLAGAVVSDRVDLDHPAAADYIARKLAPSAPSTPAPNVDALADAVVALLLRRVARILSREPNL